MMRSLITSTIIQHFSGDQINKNENRGTWITYGGEWICIQGFGGETRGKEPAWKTQAYVGL
jgi:hypothetical protein